MGFGSGKEHLMEKLNRLVIDASDAITDLCVLGVQYPTDKSPYVSALEVGHPYSAVYDFLFSARRYEPLHVGEIGVAANMSFHIWRAYFTRAMLYGFDCFDLQIENARSHHLPNVEYIKLNMNEPDSIFNGLNSAKTYFDVLIDDSTHAFHHQIWFIQIGLAFMKPGGMMCIEDVFCEWDEERYNEALRPYFKYFSSGLFVKTNHSQRPNVPPPDATPPYYNNDKLIVMFRNEVPAPMRAPLPPPYPLLDASRQRLKFS
jgi:hypothetical protein